MMKRNIAIILILAMMLVILSACGDGSDNSADGFKTEQFSYWLSVGESSFFYTQYQDNPVMQYIFNNMTFQNAEGGESRIKINFDVPASGTEVDSYNLMISTDNLFDVMCLNFGMPIEEMYEAGQVLDLTYYVENHMPNYKAFLDENPELVPFATYSINGERKFLHIPGAVDMQDIYEQFCGVAYRRDWIVKYGTPPAQLWSLDAGNNKVYSPNPNAGTPFAFHYSLDWDGNSVHTTELTDTINPDSWIDNVIFPSGNPDPIYISDWEWMMEIFAHAIADQGINDGYVMSLYYPGYIGTGDIVTAFGGGGPFFYRHRETDRAAFGAVEEGFKTYMQAMNQWWQNGWIDREFRDKSDMFFSIDETKIFQGKKGVWVGVSAHLGARTRSDVQPLTHGAMVFGAPQPINDIYGPDSVRFVEPYTMFGAIDVLGGGIVITNSAKDKDITVLARFFDYFWSHEGALLKTMGFSEEQMERIQSPIYLEHGLDNGAYFEHPDGMLQFVPAMERDDGGMRGAMTATRIPGLRLNSVIRYSYTPTYIHSREQWVRYPATGFFGGMFNSQQTVEEARTREQIGVIIDREYMQIVVPMFITGEMNFNEDYDSFVTNLERRGYQRVVDILDAVIDRLR